MADLSGWALGDPVEHTDRCNSCGTKEARLRMVSGPSGSMRVCPPCAQRYESVGWEAEQEGLNAYQARAEWKRLFGELPPTTKEGEFVTEEWDYERPSELTDEVIEWERRSGMYGDLPENHEL